MLMDKTSRKLAVFVTNLGIYEPLVMFFRLTNSLAIFQIIMNTLFKNLIYVEKVAVYIDNILVFSKTIEEHIKIVQQVL